MKTNKLFLAGLSALTAAVVGGLPARAATINADASEIFLAFRASGNLGAENVYLVQLGTYNLTNFPNTPGTTFQLGITGIGADLIANFGANWYNRADLNWGIFGTSEANPPTTIYASRERPSVGTQSTPWPALNVTDVAAPRNSIQQVFNAIDGSTSTANNTVGFFQNGSATASGQGLSAGSYAFAISPQVSPGALDFGAWSRIEGDFGDGTVGTALDLYRFNTVNDTPGQFTVAYRGTFSINDTGTVTYSNLAVPEPTSAVLMAFAGSVALGLRRWRPAPSVSLIS